MYHLDDSEGQLISIDQRLFSSMKGWFEVKISSGLSHVGDTVCFPLKGLQAMLIQNKSCWDLFEQLAATSHGKPGYYRLKMLSTDETVACSLMNRGNGFTAIYILPSNFILVYTKCKPVKGDEETSVTEPT